MQRAVLEWTDANADWLRVAWNLATGSTVAALAGAVQGASNAGIREQVEGARVIVNNVPSDAQYASVENLALLTFCTAVGTMVRITFPAPIASIVLASGEIDATQPEVSAIITAALADLVDQTGNPVIAYAGGSIVYRRKDQP